MFGQTSPAKSAATLAQRALGFVALSRRASAKGRTRPRAGAPGPAFLGGVFPGLGLLGMVWLYCGIRAKGKGEGGAAPAAADALIGFFCFNFD